MLYLTKTAHATATDGGEFEALVATYDLDRTGDRIEPGAFSKTIAAWKASGRKLPLQWNHATSPADVVGHVDPESLFEDPEAGLLVSGQVDLETERGQQVWRLLKSNSVAFSFGYLTTGARELGDGTRLLTELDLFEVSVTPRRRTRIPACWRRRVSATSPTPGYRGNYEMTPDSEIATREEVLA
jgi:HK97 family phage prohead protease